MPVIHDAVLWVQELGWNNMGEFWQHSWPMIVVMAAILLAGFGFQKYKAEPLKKHG
jgi:Tfp pilus assembly protein PilO